MIFTRVEHHVALRAARDDVGIGQDIAVLGEDDARADHGAAVAHAGEHRDGGGVDLLIDLLDAQLLAVRFAVAELDLVGVGQALDGRFAVVVAVVVVVRLAAVLKPAVIVGGVSVEDAAVPQRGDRAAEHDEAEHTEEEYLQSLSAA